MGTTGPSTPEEGTVEEAVERPALKSVEQRLHDALGQLVHGSGEGEAAAEGESYSGPFSPLDEPVPRRPSRRRSFSSPMVQSAPFPSVEELRGTQDAADVFGDERVRSAEGIAPGSSEARLGLSTGPEIPVPRRPSRPRSSSPAVIESAPFPSVEELRGTAKTPYIFVDERGRSPPGSPVGDVSGFGLGPRETPSPCHGPSRFFESVEPIAFPRMGRFPQTQSAASGTAAPVDRDQTISPENMETMDMAGDIDWATELMEGDFGSPSFLAMGSVDLPRTGIPSDNTILEESGSRPGVVPGPRVESVPTVAPHLTMKSGPRNAPDLSFANTPQGGWLAGYPPILPSQTMPQAVSRQRLPGPIPTGPPQSRYPVHPVLPSEPGANVSSEFGRGGIPGWGMRTGFPSDDSPVAAGGLGANPESVSPVDIPDFCISDVPDGEVATDDPPAAPVPPFATAAEGLNPQPVPPVGGSPNFSINNVPNERMAAGFPTAAPAPRAAAGPSAANAQSMSLTNPFLDFRIGNMSDGRMFSNFPPTGPQLTALNTVGIREVPCLGCLVLLINWTM